jgi:hypothetical protein
MLPAQSGAFGSFYANNPQAVILAGSVRFDANNAALLNIEHDPRSSQVIIRKSGLYKVIATVQTIEPSQFAIYINDILDGSTVVGINVGDNQLVSRQIMSLHKHDVLTVRNYLSASGTVNLDTGAGGIAGTTNSVAASLVLFRFAPLEANKIPRPQIKLITEEICIKEEKDKKCVKDVRNIRDIKEEKYIYPNLTNNNNNNNNNNDNELLYKLIVKKFGKDKSFATNSNFPAFGSFYRTTSQTLNVGDSVIFEAGTAVTNIGFTANTSKITIELSGEYYAIFNVGTNKSAQFTMFKNGQPIPNTTVGIDSGASQLLLGHIIQFNAGDVITIQNYTSALGTILINQNSGGAAPGVDANLTIVRISPLISDLDSLLMYNPKHELKNLIKQNEIDNGIIPLPKITELDRFYSDFKRWLILNNIAIGFDAFAGIFNNSRQVIKLEKPMVLYIDKFLKNIIHIQGTTDVIIQKAGTFLIHVDCYADSASQFTIFINGVPNVTTTSGTDSGSGLCSLRQIILDLKKGDIFTVVNHSSGVGSVTTSENQGGTAVGINVNFILMMLKPTLKRKAHSHIDVKSNFNSSCSSNSNSSSNSSSNSRNSKSKSKFSSKTK